MTYSMDISDDVWQETDKERRRFDLLAARCGKPERIKGLFKAIKVAGTETRAAERRARKALSNQLVLALQPNLAVRKAEATLQAFWRPHYWENRAQSRGK